MSGLRESQKAQREQRILQAAERRFREQGYEQTRIEDVAREARISVGTVYNYFANKSDLLLTLVTIHDDFISQEIDDLIKAPPKDLLEGVCGFFCAMSRHSLEHLGRENWRHLYGIAITQRQSILGQRFAKLNTRLQERIVRLLTAMQAAGLLSSDCEIPKLGGVLYRVETMLYMELVASDEMSFEDYREGLLDELRFLLRPHVAQAEAEIIAIPQPSGL